MYWINIEKIGYISKISDIFDFFFGIFDFFEKIMIFSIPALNPTIPYHGAYPFLLHVSIVYNRSFSVCTTRSHCLQKLAENMPVGD